MEKALGAPYRPEDGAAPVPLQADLKPASSHPIGGGCRLTPAQPCVRWRAMRRLSAMMVSVGLKPPDDTNTEPSAT